MKVWQIFFIASLLFAAVQNVFAQSGRSVSVPETKASNPSKEVLSCASETEKVVYIHPQIIKNFVEELNRLGKCGYRLKTADKLRLRAKPTAGDLYVFGVLQRDSEETYEYDWFQANSPSEIVTKANILAEKGFYFRRNMMFTWLCGDSGEDDEEEQRNQSSKRKREVGQYSSDTNGSVFIFERKSGIVKKNQYRLLNGADVRGGKTLEQNQTVLDSYVAEGYRPVGIYYLGEYDLFAIIAEKDEEVQPEGNYRILRYKFNPSKQFTELGREGYMPILVGMYFAILHRTDNQPIPVSYLSIDKFEEFDKKLPKFQQAIYQVRGLGLYDFGCDLSLNKLFFVVPSGDIPKREQKFLNMTNVHERKIKKKDRVTAYAQPPNAEMLRKFRELLEQGYVVRDVFDSNEVIVIFEREVE